MSDFERAIGLGTLLTAPQERAQHLGSRLDVWFAHLTRTPVRLRIYVWGVPIVITLIAAIARLYNLGHPGTLVFDETFYVKDAWSLVNLGYSSTWQSGADEAFAAGDPTLFTTTGSYVVHPPLGKWLIGLGMAIGGPENPASWRIATAVVGILSVVVLFLIAKKLFRSILLGGIAGLLLAIDGNAIVMSRVALLDNFVMFFALLGFGAILLDRQWSARQLREWVDGRAGRELLWGPVFWARPWLVAAAVAFGLTAGVKWSGLYFLAAFALYTVVVDALARRRVGIYYWPMTFPLQGAASFLLTVPLALLVYLSTWASWFTTSGGYDRSWASGEGNAAAGILSWIPLPLQSFVHYQVAVYQYHVGEMRPHNYQANPLTWLLMMRPTSMYYQASDGGENGCLADSCGSSIAGIANPLIWWAATAALAYLVYRLARFRDGRAGLILMGMVAGYLPWLMYLNRTVFQFYTIAFEPFMLLALTMAIGSILGSRHDPPDRRQNGIRVVAVFLIAALLVSAFFWPLWTGQQIDYELMRAHWWLPSWR